VGQLQIPQKGIFEALSRLERAPESPRADVLTRARRLAYFLDREGSPVPFVFPTEIGGIQFEWRGADRELELEILPEETRLSFLTMVNGRSDREGAITDIEREVRELLAWMRSR